MAVNPPSDIVLDVLKAGDPSRVAALTQRLNALGVGSGDFTKVLDATSKSSLDGFAGVTSGESTSPSVSNKQAVADQKAAHAEVEFEASILNSLVGEMLPKDAPAIYGTGTAGDIWKSMLGDQISRQIAKSGELGIARRLFATHPLPQGNSQRHVSRITSGGAADSSQTSVNLLSMASGADYGNDVLVFPHRNRS